MDDEEEEIFLPDRGVMNEVWVFTAALLNSTPVQRWNALAGLVSFFKNTPADECFDRVEVIDVLLQNLYTGKFTHPYAYLEQKERETNPLTEVDLNQFLENLAQMPEADYTEENPNEGEKE